MSKKLIIRDLVKEIDAISATDFESICYELFKIKYSKIDILHNGTNVDDRPVKGTLDITSGNLEICLECSVQKDYFQADYDKISNDINHILTLSGGSVSKLYLFCSHAEPPSFRASWIQSAVYLNNQSFNITIFDGRKIAEKIYECCIMSGKMFDVFGGYLPDFKKNMERETYFEDVPQLVNDYVEPTEIMSSLVEHIQKNNITVVSGISGSGKTQLSIFYCKKNNESFENIFWISAEDYEKNTTLDNFKRGGININLCSIFNENKSLLVIDNYNKIVEENLFPNLDVGFSKGSRLLITSQLYADKCCYFPLQNFPEETALKILGDDSENAKAFISKINLPVVLNAIKSLHSDGAEYLEIYDDLMAFLGDLADDRNEKIIDRILHKYTNKNELSLIANILNSKFDVTLLRLYIKLVPFSNLSRASLLMFENNNTTCTIHDFLKKCLQCSDESVRFIEFISKYLDEKKGVMDEYVLRQIHISFESIKKIVLSQRESLNWITYALLQKETNSTKSEIYRTLAQKQFTPDLTLEQVCCLLEVKEAYNYDNKKEEGIIQNYEAELNKALDVYSDSLIKKHLYHHLGKTQRRMGKTKEAIEQFCYVLKIEPDCFPAYGQIMKCARRKFEYKSDYNVAAKKIIEAIKEKNEKIPFRTALAFISDLRSGDLDEIYPNTEELCGLFKSIVLKAAYDGMYQFYEAFVAFVNFFSYPSSLAKECLDLYDRIPMLKYICVETINKENYANVLDAFSVIYGLLPVDDSRKSQIKVFILQLVKKMEESEKSYEIRSALKALNKVGCFQEVAQFKVNEKLKNDMWILYWQAKASIELNNSDCLILIDAALVDETRLGKKKAAFFQCKAKSLIINQKIDEAKMWYAKAIDACSSEDFRKALQKELDELG